MSLEGCGGERVAHPSRPSQERRHLRMTTKFGATRDDAILAVIAMNLERIEI
jgi:hypothetical protein